MAKDIEASGCGCVLIIFIIIGLFVLGMNWGMRNEGKSNKEQEIKSSEHTDDISRVSISDEDIQYLDCHLETGETPYKEFYGSNYVCTRNQCSAIEVTAPDNSDIVVIIKRGNEDGKVISHAYIRAGSKYTFDLPNGTFQPFFYYGEGWNPEKEMGNGVKGGFVRYESFSKDNPQAINDCVLSYVLKLQRDGNFQTKGSSRGEMF